MYRVNADLTWKGSDMLFRAIVLAASAMLMGCATTATTTLPSVDAVQYRLSPGDKLKLEVFREDSLSGEYVINDQGVVGLPMVGDVKAAGKTLSELRAELTATLGQGYVRNARINLDVVSYRPIYILGEVQKPGEYDYAGQMSVYALVAKAGGFTYRANEKVVFIRHINESAETAYQLTSGASVLPGDTVRIDQRYF
jgi:polysaccharide export outer membrane protein